MGFLFSKPQVAPGTAYNRTRRLRYGRTAALAPKQQTPAPAPVPANIPALAPTSTPAASARVTGSPYNIAAAETPMYPTMDSYTKPIDFKRFRGPQRIRSLTPEQKAAETERAIAERKRIVDAVLSVDISTRPASAGMPLHRINARLGYNSVRNLKDSLTEALRDYATLKTKYVEETAQLESDLLAATEREEALDAIERYYVAIYRHLGPLYNSVVVSHESTYDRIMEVKAAVEGMYGPRSFPIEQDKLAEWASDPAPADIVCDTLEADIAALTQEKAEMARAEIADPDRVKEVDGMLQRLKGYRYYCYRALVFNQKVQALITKKELKGALDGLYEKARLIGTAIGLKQSDVEKAGRLVQALDLYIAQLQGRRVGGSRKTRRNR